MGHYKYNKNGIRDKLEYVQPHLKMITRIRKTSKWVKTPCGIKYLYTYTTTHGSVLFRYALTDNEVSEKFRSALNLPIEQPVLKTKYPSLDILLNNEFIITN